MLAKLRNSFLTGLVVIIPILGTYLILQFLFLQLNDMLLNPLLGYINSYMSLSYMGGFVAKAIILVCLFMSIIFVGFAARLIFIRRFFGFLEKLFFKVPLISRVYLAIKEISSAMFMQSHAVFRRVVLIEYPRNGIYAIAFVTTESMNALDAHIGAESVNVFVPTTPNPTSGVLVIVPRDQVIPLDLTVEEGFKLVVSGGIVHPPQRVS